MHERTQETTWKQPLPRLGPAPEWDDISPSMRDICFVVVDNNFFGACAAPALALAPPFPRPKPSRQRAVRGTRAANVT